MDLSVIIVSFNTKKLTKECLESVIKNTKGIRYEIIVVDNGSTDGSVAMLQKIQIPKSKFQIIANKENLGFGRANNQGVEKAKGKYILLLNSDTKISDNVLGEMVSWMNAHPKAGVATCALRNTDNSLQGTGGYFPHLFKVFAWMFFLEDIPLLGRMIKPFHPMHPRLTFCKGEGFFKNKHQQDWVTGAFLLTRKKIIDKIGLFDPDYFMYVEEVDFCFRVKLAGWQVWYLPQWSIIHFGGASSTRELPLLSEYEGIKIFYKKHKPSWQMPILKLFLKGGALLRMLVFGFLKKPKLAKVYAKVLKKV
jgi:hypothetical protein